MPGKEMRDKNDGIVKNVISYNEYIFKLQDQYTFAEVLSSLRGLKVDEFYEDGYHPNPKGNKIISEKLINSIDNKFVN
tara:strand:+ start:11877 stop:12110 length:234 start_codon:yes stop_codon:yes gene_type:complete